MKGQKEQYVTIKGTKDGLTLHLDDTCSFNELLSELEEKLSINPNPNENSQQLPVRVKVGNRFLSTTQETHLKSMIENKNQLVVASIDCNVMSKSDALELQRKSTIVSVTRMIRSGQVLKVDSDLLLIGDVNPGGTVIAEGNIFIMGSLKGVAHAGYLGNSEAVIAASIMRPSQLRIAEIMNRAPDYITDEKHEMECAYIDENGKIIIDRLQQLMHIRPNLTRLEGGI
ncbi:septum site-determining protein MinC [Bacillus timonensis]|nr:septum site-determining protein MinC [Bacillus timonensis]